MIRVVRNLEPEPPLLKSKDAQDAYHHASAHFASDEPSKRQFRFQFRPLFQDPLVRTALSRLFAGKCAFCESPIALDSLVVHHLRPLQESISEDGEVSREHYWWLAYTWENLYPSCQHCSDSAGAGFPVEGTRAETLALGSTLLEEKPFLLDPCFDNPSKHLSFESDGSVKALTRRGEETIVVYGLNRRSLIEDRLDAILPYIGGARSARPELTEPYAGAIVSVLNNRTASIGSPPKNSVLQRVLRPYSSRGRPWTKALRQPFGRNRPQVRPVVIERLELRNFRSIEHLVLELASPDDIAPWTVLLGENGHGKTSVLQALAIVLAGADDRRQLIGKSSELIRAGADSAEVIAHVRGVIEPRTLRLARGSRVIRGEDNAVAVAAYGAARIPPSMSSLPFRPDPRRPRVENLFDPAVPLTGAERWLLGIDPDAFDYAARALRRLLLLPDTTVVERREGGVVLRTARTNTYLSQLSDGYRSMIALAADIMNFFMGRYGSMDAAEGLVLVDEISAHLHPRWQMRVIESFREAFPRLQFVVTTHDPLCLRGVSHQREVTVLRRTQDGEVFALPASELPAIKGLRVDELLTSEVFGLSSTIDPGLEREFDRYYSLLTQHDRSRTVEHEIVEIKRTLAAHRQFGSSRRERIALEAADEYLAREVDISAPHMREQMLDETKRHLRSIWENPEP